MIFYVEISVIFRVCENALYGLVMNCLKKCFQTKTQKKFLTLCFLVKYMYVWNVHQNGQGIITKAFSWFCISEKSKFPGKYQEQPYVQPAIFSGGRFLFVPKASTPALIDEVNALPLLI